MASYLAFPPHSASPYQSSGRNDEPRDNNNEASSAGQAQEWAWEDRQKRDAETSGQTLQSEHKERFLGEVEWVRAGGRLRDPYGRSDSLRTRQLREEIRVLDEERRVLELWDAYQTRWHALLASTAPIAFADVPWPVSSSTTSVSIDDLTPDAIHHFVMAPLRVRGNSVSRKERIRHLLLRWHPDKLSAVIARTTEQDRGVVNAGVNTVFYVLKDMQDLERHPDVSG